MRRAACFGVLVLAATRAEASPSTTTVTAEGGGEVDTNVQRVETAPGLDTVPVIAGVARLGAKLDHRGRVAGGGYALGASTLARLVTDRYVTSENAVLLAGDLRWLHAIGERGVSGGVALQAADAIPFDEATSSRTFRNLGADGVLVLRHDDERSLSLFAGARRFTWKPDADYSYQGPALTARLDLVLWAPSGGARSVELAVAVGYEGRAYESTAFASACPEDAPPNPTCFAPTTRLRHDRYQRAGAEVTWVGRAVTTAGYQVIVVDSNSYGQSFARHRVTASVTMDLPWRLYGTALGSLQIDQYFDGLVIQRDVLNQQFTSLDDENRSSFQVRLARQVTEAWSLEGRFAVWRNLRGTVDTSFQRELFYVGAVYQR